MHMTTNPETIDGKSLDVVGEKIDRLRELLPDVFSEGKIDFNHLKAALGEAVYAGDERYQISWAGKYDAFKEIQKQTTATLVPDRPGSVDFDSSQHIFIEGENLEVLRVLQKAYYGKVKMIYIDPPYNTGSDSFVYPDDYAERKEEYEKRAGIRGDSGFLNKQDLWRKNSKENGQFHSVWISMMYPRLYLARNLLREDGVIFVSIDDNEVHNLRMLMNEVFGEENFITLITVLCNPKGRSQDKYFATNSEYIIVYSKNILPKGSFSIDKDEDQVEAEYPEEDENGKYRLLELRNTHREFGRHNRKNLFYPFFVNPKSGKVCLENRENFIRVLPIWDDGYEGCWTWDTNKAEKDLDFILSRKVNNQWKIYRKNYANGAEKMLKTIFLEKDFYTERGQKIFNEIFNSKNKIFQSPKSPILLKRLITTSTFNDSIVLDFFSGSCTTAHAVLDLNREDGGNRRFLCVQMPEPTEEGSEAYKAGYKTIADIGRARIRKVIEKMKSEKKSALNLEESRQDMGFKAYKLHYSNFKVWRNDIEDKEEILKQLEAFRNPLVDGAMDDREAILIEILLKAGIPLSAAVEIHDTGDGTVFTVENGRLWVALERVTPTLLAAAVAAKPQSFVCLGTLFQGEQADEMMSNAMLELKEAGIAFKVI